MIPNISSQLLMINGLKHNIHVQISQSQLIQSYVIQLVMLLDGAKCMYMILNLQVVSPKVQMKMKWIHLLNLSHKIIEFNNLVYYYPITISGKSHAEKAIALWLMFMAKFGPLESIHLGNLV